MGLGEDQLNLAFVEGFATGAALIVAIGAQNAFVLRQGIRREHVLAVVLVCALSDALLITLGIAGLGALVGASPMLLLVARFGGAAFLLVYGLLAARRAFGGDESLHAADRPPMPLAAAIGTCLALTYLNPHCWLDTVVLLGSIASQHPEGSRIWFGAGATSASFVWFFSLGFGARGLRKVFEKPIAWRVLDGAVALVMWTIAASLLMGR